MQSNGFGCVGSESPLPMSIALKTASARSWTALAERARATGIARPRCSCHRQRRPIHWMAEAAHAAAPSAPLGPIARARAKSSLKRAPSVQELSLTACAPMPSKKRTVESSYRAGRIELGRLQEGGKRGCIR